MIGFRRAFGICVATAMLTGCSGIGAGNGVVPADGTPDHLPGQRTFHYTGGAQDFKVPVGVTHITVVARGAAGGGYGNYEGRDIQAFGGRVRAIIPVRSGEKLVVFVGGQGSRSFGGFNGGGSGGGEPPCCGYGGGGASDIRQRGDTLANRILVAGGGGGAEAFGWPEYGGLGGKGGGIDGGAGSNGYSGGSYGSYYGGYGGGGGTQNGGGDGGAPGYGSGGYGGDSGSSGSLGAGGSGGKGGGTSSYVGGGGGGGGGGYYGGGGGGGGGGYVGGPGGGGGGGSTYIEPSAYSARSWQGWKDATGDGLVVFSW
ncbi:MAG: hypothetical protein ABSF08_03825 [Candidatus Cybelea sp.]|jgi:hypothetical protein